jgi:taurine--2-oxoglutarate transaminase
MQGRLGKAMSNPLVERQRERVFYTWTAQSQAAPLEIVGGKGARFRTADGAEWMDLGSMTWNANLGHGHEGMRRKLMTAVEKNLLVIPAAVYEDKARAGELLCEIAGPGLT